MDKSLYRKKQTAWTHDQHTGGFFMDIGEIFAAPAPQYAVSDADSARA